MRVDFLFHDPGVLCSTCCLCMGLGVKNKHGPEIKMCEPGCDGTSLMFRSNIVRSNETIFAT